MRSMYICQYKIISKYNVNWKNQDTEAYLVSYHWYGKVCALKMFGELHKKLLTGVSSEEETGNLEWKNHFSFDNL